MTSFYVHVSPLLQSPSLLSVSLLFHSISLQFPLILSASLLRLNALCQFYVIVVCLQALIPYSITPSFISFLLVSLTYSLIICAFVHSSIQLLIYSFIDDLLIYLCICSLIRKCF